MTFNKTEKIVLRFVRLITPHLPSDMTRKSNGHFEGGKPERTLVMLAEYYNRKELVKSNYWFIINAAFW